jgi:hypothetical protein
MDRLRCGVIYTQAFTNFLREWWLAEPTHHGTKIPSLHFVHCREGSRAGESWASLSWILEKKLPEHELFEVAGIRLHLPKQSQKGLQWRCLDARNGQLCVIGGN